MGPAGPPRGPLGSNQTLVNSKNVTNRCSHICFSDDKNVFGITHYSLGALSGARKAPRAAFRVKPELGQFKKCLAPGLTAPPEELEYTREAGVF